MQVNNVQSSQNFGMALRIKPEAVEALKKCTRAEVEKLQKVGEALKDTKYYHLEIGKNGERTIITPYKNRYRGGSLELEYAKDEFLHYTIAWKGIGEGNLGSGITKRTCTEFANNEAAREAFFDLEYSINLLEKDAKMVKYLDARAIQKKAEETAVENERKAIEDMVDELFEKYAAK